MIIQNWFSHPVKTARIAWFFWREIKIDEFNKPIRWYHSLWDASDWTVWGW